MQNPFKDSIVLKIIIIAIIILVLLIPTAMIRSLIQERQYTFDNAVTEVGSKWGQKQAVAGPILTIPYDKIVAYDTKGNPISQLDYAYFLPDTLNIDGEMVPEVLKRGIYDIVGYKSTMKFNGKFSRPNFANAKISASRILWNNATISIAIMDMKGINENVKLNWGGSEFLPKPGVDAVLTYMGQPYDQFHEISSGVKFQTSMEDLNKNSFDYSFDISLNGSQELNFLPLGSETTAKLASTWPTPSFDGSFLPIDRELTEDGFKANWKILQLNRNFPQSWVGKAPQMNEASFGVKLLVPVDHYQKNERSVKYAVMVLALTFLIFFFVEILNKIRIHPVQYILTGFALVLFFTLLLSLSEHIGFNFAYFISAIATILLITLYSRTIFKNSKISSLQAVILGIIYLFIFTIIQLQDYALLMGSVGLFIVLATTMYISRKVDWYAFQERNR